VPLNIQALWILCALGAAVFAAGAAKWRNIMGLLIGFGAATALFRGGLLPEPGWVGGLVAMVAGLALYRPRWAFAGSLCGGFLAGLLGALMQFLGLGLAPSLALAAVVPAVSLWFARKPGFAPLAIREEALVLMLALGFGAAVVPAVVEGWRSAAALNTTVRNGAQLAIPVWALALSGASMLLGGAWSVWRHR
jgi:hypothetical protein